MKIYQVIFEGITFFLTAENDDDCNGKIALLFQLIFAFMKNDELIEIDVNKCTVKEILKKR